MLKAQAKRRMNRRIPFYSSLPSWIATIFKVPPPAWSIVMSHISSLFVSFCQVEYNNLQETKL